MNSYSPLSSAISIRAMAAPVVASMLLLACGNATGEAPSSSAEPAVSADESISLSRHGGGSDVASPQLVVQGRYSDRRFIDMMAPHHMMAVDMAQMALTKAHHAELRQMAQSMIDSQSAEIAELKAIKAREFGSGQVPSRMDPDEIANSGMPSMNELEHATDFDCAFIDAMSPHHAGAIRMASVARRWSGIAELRTMSRSIIDAQSTEIGEMDAWRTAWCAAESP